jgi:hypothetical protein
MFTAALILILSTGLFSFYLQAACQKILRRQFAHEYWLAVVKTNRLEFPAVRKALKEHVEYPRIMEALKCDFLALTYLLKYADKGSQYYSREAYLLILYFRVCFASLAMRRWLRLREAPAALELTAILEYFANVIGERENNRRSGSGFLPPLSPA